MVILGGERAGAGMRARERDPEGSIEDGER